MSSTATPEKSSSGSSPTSSTPTSGALQAATAQTARFNEVVDKIRGRADTGAKSLLGVGGLAFGALGITKATDLVPQYFAGSTLVAVGAVVVGVLCIGGALGWLSVRLWRVNTPVVTTSNLQETLADLLSDEEKVLVRDVYDDMARLNDAPSLQAYEARGWRFQRIAERADADRKTELLGQADLIRAEVRATQSRAAALVVRERASRALTGWPAVVIVGMFLTGLLVLTGGAGFLTNAKYDAQIATAKACAEARSAITDSKANTVLPARCGAVQAVAPSAPVDVAHATEAENRRIGQVLSDLVRACYAATPAQPREVCQARLDDLTRATAPR